MAGLLWYRSYMDSLANTRGYYPDIHAGHADRVSELTLEAPYLVRETPAEYNQLELMELVGGSVAWNQLCNSSSVTGTSGHKFYLKKSGVESITNTNTFTGLASGTDMVTDLTLMLGSAIADYVYSLEQATAGSGIAWLKSYGFFTEDYIAYSAPTLQSVEATAHVTVGFNQFDPTSVLVGTMSSNVWTIPTGTTANRKALNFRFMDGVQYCFSGVSKQSAANKNTRLQIVYTDGTTSNVWASNSTDDFPFTFVSTSGKSIDYVRYQFGTVGADLTITNLCINFHGARDGEYEPYTEATTPLANVTLRGMLKIDADGNLYYDGDTYEWDGTVTRNWGYRAYQSGDASDGSTMITDGTNTVYKLDTPTTESADPFTAVQSVEDGGTEEFVTTNGVPVGNVSVYRRA